MKLKGLLVFITLCGLLTTSCSKPIVEEKVIYIDRPVKVVKEIEVIKEVEKVVEVEVPVYIEVEKIVEVDKLVALSDWADIKELKAFLEADGTDSHIYLVANSGGVVKFNNQCEDSAIQLMDNAMAIGKRLSFVPLHRAEYYKWYSKRIDKGHYHAICVALVGDNELWYIEPSNDKVWLAIYLD